MNSDSYYEIGYSHTVCQDYAINGDNGVLKYAIISDGCSSSKNSDIGARLLAHLFKQYQLIPENIIMNLQQLSNMTDIIQINPEFLDSTLLIAFMSDKKTTVNIFGDGGFYVKFKDGHFEYYLVDFDQNAPLYISYFLHDTYQNYYKYFPNQKISLIKVSGKDWNEATTEVEDLTSFKNTDLFKRLMFNFENVSFISVFSDGVRSFTMQDDNGLIVPVNDLSIVSRFNSYKSFQGQFVQRRMNKINKENKKLKISHYDDISIATIHMEQK